MLKFGVYVGEILLYVITEIQRDLLVFYFGDKPFETMDIRQLVVN